MQEEKDLWSLSKISDKYTTKSGVESLDELLERLGPNNQKLLTAEEVEEVKTTGQVTIGSRTIVFGLPDEEDELKIGDVVEATGLATFMDSGNNNIKWIYFGKDDSGKNLVTTEKPLTNTFELNKQPSGASNDEKIANAAKSWLYYDLQENDYNYSDEECTTENNINKFCENLYTTNGGTVGKARSITLEDINRVTGFKAPTFNKYIFGTTNDYLDKSVTGNHTVDYYYPTFDTKNQTTATGSTPKVYKYWKKASSSSDTKEYSCEAYYYFKDSGNDSYKLLWEGTNRDWSEETLSETSSWKLETPENMKYVVGEDTSNYYLYAVGSCSVALNSSNAYFFSSGVRQGFVDGCYYNFCNSPLDNNYDYDSYSPPVRPLVSLESEVKLNKVQKKYEK